jgi:hypothetical protein
MAFADLNLLQMKFLHLASKDELLNKQRQESIAAGRTQEADVYFLEYASNRTQAEQLSRELVYPDFDAAKKDVLLILARSAGLMA